MPAVVAAIAGLAHPAGAAPCSGLPNPIYGLGGSAAKPFLGKLSKALSSLPAPNTATIVFQAPGACLGIYGLLDDNARLTGTASYWGPSGVEATCELPAGGQPIDFANMANSAALCPQAPDPLPNTIGDFPGAVNTVVLITALSSSQSVISAAAAYLTFGFGPDGQAAPWTNDAALFIRDQNSAVQQLLGLAIDVPASKFAHGTNALNQNGVINGVRNSTDPEASLGLVSGEAADAARANVKTLAYQHYGQSCGYLPDSTSTAFDKRNVRDGHYFIWTPGHFFAKVDPATGIPVNPLVRRVLGYLDGSVAVPDGFNPRRVEIESGTVPQCAMKVWRTGDLGPISRYTPAKSCGCYFDSLTGGTSCQACLADGDCPATAHACNYGYCEVQ